MVICGTGHRPDRLGIGHSDEAFQLLVRMAEKHIKALSPTEVISGMALGWDQAIAQACINLKVLCTAAIPFDGQHVLWSEADQLRYYTIVNQIPSMVLYGAGYAGWKMMGRNKWMIDRSDTVLALWDGGSLGGTADAVRYAGLRGARIVNVWSDWVDIRKELA